MGQIRKMVNLRFLCLSNNFKILLNVLNKRSGREESGGNKKKIQNLS